MPVHEEMVGPIPAGREPEEYDKLRRRVLWSMPYGLYVVGARAGQRRNAMTLNFASQVATDPKMIAISVWKEAVTHELVGEGRVFVLNLIDREESAIVRKFVKPVDVDEAGRTLNGFPFHDGPGGAPVLDQAVAWIDCRVEKDLDCGDHTLFVGEVLDCGFQKAEDTPVLRMEDTRMNYGG
ncbi:MAG TPA: flavin reductase family protein [Acidimicrobiales bacterium]|nr:flavin reductase family protein [Acidimicrobiales bacterium]